MQDKLTKIFQKTKYEPETNFNENIWNAIIIRNKTNAQIKLWVFSLTGIISMAGLVPTIKILLNNFAQTGFYEYFSLIFSENISALSYWKELALSLAESLPIMSIVFTLSLLFISFLSIKYVVKQITKGQLVFTNSNLLSF